MILQIVRVMRRSTKMERVNLNLRTKYLSETQMFQNGTPSNYIIFKKLCGTGATHGEALIYPRHSIIIVPNTPVLKGKKEAVDDRGNKKYPNILCVYEGVSLEDVSEYLASSVEYKKILCTPEAYIKKVKPAIEDHPNFDLFNDFFMLLDECDKIIKDADFRYNLVVPVDDFFQFKNKSMISATALIPSDIRFEQQNFKRLYVKPKFKFKQKITLIDTNNIISALNQEFEKDPNGRFFIFLNSTELIQAVIELLEIEKESKVFCAQISKTKLTDNNFEANNISTDLGGFAKYNFLTSRFYTAVDIELPEKPNVIMVTDVLRKAYSMLDPYSDCIQIVGRFRDGVKNIVHISNFAYGMEWKERARAMLFLKDNYDAYKSFQERRDNSTKEGELSFLNKALQDSFIRSYIMESGELDPYLVDGYLLDQKVISYYLYMNRLNLAYLRSNYFRPNVETKNYNVSDLEIIKSRLKLKVNEHLENIVNILYANDAPLEEDVLRYDFGRSNKVIAELYPEIHNFYKVLGYEAIEKVNFNKSEVSKLCAKKEKEDMRFNPDMVVKIQKLFKKGDTPQEFEIVAQFQKIYIEFGCNEHARSSHISRYFLARRTSNQQGLKVWKVEDLLEI